MNILVEIEGEKSRRGEVEEVRIDGVDEKQTMYILVGFASGWEGEEGERNEFKGEQHLL